MGTKDQPTPIPNHMQFVIGGIAGMCAISIVHPMDVTKINMQLMSIGSKTKTYKHTGDVFFGIYKREGFFALYQGLSANLLRQSTYTTIRIGSFQTLTDEYISLYKESPPFHYKVLIGMFSGGIGAVAGLPADICVMRMVGDLTWPKEKRRNYHNVFNGIRRILKEEGFTMLYRGGMITVNRAMVVNACDLPVYTQAKEFFLKHNIFHDNVYCHIASAMAAGLSIIFCSLPIDSVKTRIQAMEVVAGKPTFDSSWHVFTSIIKHEGFFALWKGFTPYYCRFTPQIIAQYFFLEQLRNLYRDTIV